MTLLLDTRQCYVKASLKSDGSATSGAPIDSKFAATKYTLIRCGHHKNSRLHHTLEFMIKPDGFLKLSSKMPRSKLDLTLPGKISGAIGQPGFVLF
jgi:hypothetical protein